MQLLKMQVIEKQEGKRRHNISFSDITFQYHPSMRTISAPSFRRRSSMY